MTDKPSIGNELLANLARASPVGILWLAERGLDVYGYTNPCLSWVIWGVATIWLWWSIWKSGLMGRVFPQYARSRLVYGIGVALLGLSFGAKAWYSPWHKSMEIAPPNTEVIKAIKDANERQAEEFAKLRAELATTAGKYFTSQPPDENEKWRKYLTPKYPLGWGMFATDGNTVYTPRGLSYERDFAVVWDPLGVEGLTLDHVALRLPTVSVRGTKASIEHVGVAVDRAVGKTQRWVRYRNTDITVEILEDKGDFVVFAVGFQEADKSGRPKSQRSPTKAIP